MQTVLFITSLVSLVVMVVALGCLVSMLLSKKMRKNWKVRLTFGICVTLFAVDSLVRLFVFRKSQGWIYGLCMVVYIYLGWQGFSEAKKLRAAQKK